MRFATAALLSLLAVSLVAADRGPSTAEERSNALQMVRLLEQNPLAPKARDARQWLILWSASIPDITVDVCLHFVGGVQNVKKFPRASEIQIQTAFGQLAYQLEHPDAKPDGEATFVAGVESALKVYEAIVAAEPKSRTPFLDELIAKRDKNELPAFVHANMEGCSK